MDDLGDPIAYLALSQGVPVFTADGQEIGAVEHVLADEGTDIFDGLVIGTRLGPGGHRFVDAPQVAALYERGAVLTLDAAEAGSLPEPSANPAVMAVDPDDVSRAGLTDRLRRAWARISGG